MEKPPIGQKSRTSKSPCPLQPRWFWNVSFLFKKNRKSLSTIYCSIHFLSMNPVFCHNFISSNSFKKKKTIAVSRNWKKTYFRTMLSMSLLSSVLRAQPSAEAHSLLPMCLIKLTQFDSITSPKWLTCRTSISPSIWLYLSDNIPSRFDISAKILEYGFKICENKHLTNSGFWSTKMFLTFSAMSSSSMLSCCMSLSACFLPSSAHSTRYSTPISHNLRKTMHFICWRHFS